MNDPQCACFEYVGDNPYCPVHGKKDKEVKKADYRKSVSSRGDEIEKRRKAGQNGRGANAFQTKKSKKDPELQKRIDAVVVKAQARDEQLAKSGQPLASGVDVVRINSSVFGTKGTRIG